eukprot:s2691_g11.t1
MTVPAEAALMRPVTLNDCRTQDPSTDQYFELTATGLLKNLPSGRCLTVIAPEDTEELSMPLAEAPVSLAECDETNVLQTFELDSTAAHLRVNGTDFCLAAASNTVGAALRTVACSDASMAMSWEFIDTARMAERCKQLCDDPGEIYDVWGLYGEDMHCQCGLWFKTPWWYNQLAEGAQGNTEYSSTARFGLVKPPNFEKMEIPSTISSSIADAFTVPANAENMSIYVPGLEILDEISDSGLPPVTPFGFTFLSEEDQPTVDRMLVDGEETFNISLGAVVELIGEPLFCRPDPGTSLGSVVRVSTAGCFTSIMSLVRLHLVPKTYASR